jgi:hypothetical protein
MDDPWSAVDRGIVAAISTRVTRRTIEAQQAAIGACRLYERTHRTSHLREAVAELEATKHFERTQRLFRPTVASCVVEKDRLRQALERALPDTAFPFYVEIVRARIDDGASAPAANKDHWLSDWRWAVQKWLRIADVGRRFEPGIQAIYDALLDEQGHAVAEREEQRRTVEEDDRREAQAIRKSAAPARISEEEGRPAEAKAKAALLDATIPIADPKASSGPRGRIHRLQDK